jgi:predicted RNA-binding Zn ribbon-like protein
VAPHWEQVDGVVLPARLAGHPALELCNTRAGWNGGPEREYLREFDHLALWAGHAGLLSAPDVAVLRRRARRERRASKLVLARALRFRATLYELLEAGPRTPARARFDTEFRHAVAALRLEWVDGCASLSVDAGAGIAAPLLAAVWSAAGLLTSGDVRFVRSCPGDGCGWLFIDRRGKRQWCTMQTCGNRAKARRFAERRKAGLGE